MAATLLFNILFWLAHGDDLRMECHIVPFAGICAAVAWVVTALFYLAPAWSAHDSSQTLPGLLAKSFGSIPAVALRLSCVVFLVLWIAAFVSFSLLLGVQVAFRPGLSSAAVSVIGFSLTVFVLVTGLQSWETGGRLALFTNKLGIALLFAAAIRVLEGFPSALVSFSNGNLGLWPGISRLVCYAGPLMLLAANFGYRSRTRKQVAMIGVGGFVLPLFASLLLVGLINLATLKSSMYQPSLNPSVTMALWAHAARSALPPRMMIAAISVFGAMRFGARSLADLVPVRLGLSRGSWLWLTVLAVIATWFGLQADALSPMSALDVSATVLISAAAVLTTDFFTGIHREQTVRRFDWIGSVAVLAGVACLPGWMWATSAEPWAHTWVLPSYGTALLVSAIGRLASGKEARTLILFPISKP